LIFLLVLITPPCWRHRWSHECLAAPSLVRGMRVAALSAFFYQGSFFYCRGKKLLRLNASLLDRGALEADVEDQVVVQHAVEALDRVVWRAVEVCE
jgi:hypothetical protein